YYRDLEVLIQYYEELWRAYVFVSPEIYRDARKCRTVIDKLCLDLNVQKELAYKKVRGHDLQIVPEQSVRQVTERIGQFLKVLPFSDAPQALLANVLEEASRDRAFLEEAMDGEQPSRRLATILEVATLRSAAAELSATEEADLLGRRCER